MGKQKKWALLSQTDVQNLNKFRMANIHRGYSNLKDLAKAMQLHGFMANNYPNLLLTHSFAYCKNKEYYVSQTSWSFLAVQSLMKIISERAKKAKKCTDIVLITDPIKDAIRVLKENGYRIQKHIPEQWVEV